MNRISLAQYLRAQTATPASLQHLIDTVAAACQRIGGLVAQGALGGVLGSHGTQNVQGEVQQTLDIMANDVLLEASAASGVLAAVASEEMDTIHRIEGAQGKDYLLLFDPLDGS